MQDQTPDKTPELQQADDMLVCMMEQRNAALNENVQLHAQLRAAARRIQTLEAVPKEAVANGATDQAASESCPNGGA